MINKTVYYPNRNDLMSKVSGFTRMVRNLPGSTTTATSPPRAVAPEPIYRAQPIAPPMRDGEIRDNMALYRRVLPLKEALRLMMAQRGLPERFWR